MFQIIKFFVLIVIINIIGTYAFPSKATATSCKEPTLGFPGECVEIAACPALQKYMEPEKLKDPLMKTIFNSYKCGGSDVSPMVCCQFPSGY